jgi:hypothetical protein
MDQAAGRLLQGKSICDTPRRRSSTTLVNL